ncbi:hypothetical protein Bhyg_10637 [Pseudolycoriella hygida]|uniref:Uncharacterized protein n=1 Tax=Pseudolycoriella hygida TaxID=35572 RepID=A0A9Q0RZ71_9DIPT|nr:hypothetical protein Bhyg_10637 [Pseudolycoriella hygida]
MHTPAYLFACLFWKFDFRQSRYTLTCKSHVNRCSYESGNISQQPAKVIFFGIFTRIEANILHLFRDLIHLSDPTAKHSDYLLKEEKLKLKFRFIATNCEKCYSNDLPTKKCLRAKREINESLMTKDYQCFLLSQPHPESESHTIFRIKCQQSRIKHMRPMPRQSLEDGSVPENHWNSLLQFPNRLTEREPHLLPKTLMLPTVVRLMFSSCVLTEKPGYIMRIRTKLIEIGNRALGHSLWPFFHEDELITVRTMSLQLLYINKTLQYESNDSIFDRFGKDSSFLSVDYEPISPKANRPNDA